MQNQVVEPASASLSKEFVSFARRQLVNATMFHSPNRRDEDRFPMMLPVIAVAVDEHLQPASDVFEMISRDVASASIGLFHPEPLTHERFVIRLDLAQTMTNLLIELIWQSQMGPFHGSAAKYLKKLEHFPVDI